METGKAYFDDMGKAHTTQKSAVEANIRYNFEKEFGKNVNLFKMAELPETSDPIMEMAFKIFGQELIYKLILNHPDKLEALIHKRYADEGVSDALSR